MNIETIIDLLDKSKNDNEKFALLLIISQLIKSNKLDDLKQIDDAKSKELNERLFNSIGSHFLARLLTTQQNTDNCPLLFYKSTSLSILIQFLDYPDLICDPILLSKLNTIFDILKLKQDQTDSSGQDEEEKKTNLKMEYDLILDTFKYLFALTKSCSDHLISNGLLNILMNDVVLNKSYEKFNLIEKQDEDLKLIACKLFTATCNGKHFSNKNKDFEKFKLEQIESSMKSLVKCVNQNQSELKFELLNYLSYFMDQTNDKQTFGIFLSNEDFYSNQLFSILNDLLKNKIKSELKKQAFVYLNNFVKLYQFEFIYMKNRNFFYLIIHLLCIEIGLNIHEVESSKLKSIDGLFLDNMYIYFTLLEEIIVILSTASPFDQADEEEDEAEDTDNDIDDEECDDMKPKHAKEENEEPELKKAIQIIVETLESIVLFVKDTLEEEEEAEQSDDKNTSLFLISCIRLLNCWLMHENLLEKELIDLMPKMIEFSHREQRKDPNLNAFDFIVPSLKRVLSDEEQYLNDNYSNRGDDDTAKFEFEESEHREYVENLSKLLEKCKVK